jgi:hypothetical protein
MREQANSQEITFQNLNNSTKIKLGVAGALFFGVFILGFATFLETTWAAACNDKTETTGCQGARDAVEITGVATLCLIALSLIWAAAEAARCTMNTCNPGRHRPSAFGALASLETYDAENGGTPSTQIVINASPAYGSNS